MNLTKISWRNGARRRNGIARWCGNLHQRLVRIYGGVCKCTPRGGAIRNWTDRENRKHAYREIVASEVRFLDAAPKREARHSGEFIAESSAELQGGRAQAGRK
jgi:hypothetical protein